MAPAGLGTGVARDILETFPELVDAESVSLQLRRLVLRPVLIGRMTVQRVLDQLQRQGVRDALRRVARGLIENEAVLADAANRVASGPIPRLVLWGEGDTINPPEHARIAAFGGQALFPFGDPPYRPFYRWALRTGRAWPSPVTLLVHETAGLMVSYRGAIALAERLDLPAAPHESPCDSCADRPCLGACPAGALTARGYDVPACHAFLDTGPGADCLSSGCALRRACPLSQAYGRLPEQSAYHMRLFHR
jgi:hypothetical protein